MSNLTDFIGGGFDPSLYTRELITTSQNWIVPAHKGKMFVIASGGGGGGFYGFIVNSISVVGGASGELVSGFMDLVAGSSVSVVIGGGGVSGPNPLYFNATPGDGGDTTFATFTARGGTGGIGSISSTLSDYTTSRTNIGFMVNTIKAQKGYTTTSITEVHVDIDKPKVFSTPVETFVASMSDMTVRTDDAFAYHVVGGASSILSRGGAVFGDATTSQGSLGSGGGISTVNDITHSHGGDGFVLVYYIPA